jgi:hypothetical protein
MQHYIGSQILQLTKLISGREISRYRKYKSNQFFPLNLMIYIVQKHVLRQINIVNCSVVHLKNMYSEYTSKHFMVEIIIMLVSLDRLAFISH